MSDNQTYKALADGGTQKPAACALPLTGGLRLAAHISGLDLSD